MRLHRKISENTKYLTKLEKDLLKLLLENRNNFEYGKFTIENISNKFSISTTSVHRLSKKLKYKSFVQFKDDYFQKYLDEDSLVCGDDSFIAGIVDTYNLINQCDLDGIINKMLNCKKIVLYGMGMSNYLCKIFRIKLNLLGIRAEQYYDSRYMRLSSKILDKNEDLVFILLRSGETPELLEVLVEVNIRGVNVVLITESRNSTFEKLCNYIVYTSYTKDLDCNIDSRLNFHIAMDYILKKFVERKI